MPLAPTLHRDDHRGILHLPGTTRGKQALRMFGAAVALCVLLIALTLIGFALPESANRSDGSPPWWLMVPMLATVVAASLAALGGGVLAIVAVRQGERSGLILLPLACALIALSFLVGDVLIGHE